jgi:hypothetical protein
MHAHAVGWRTEVCELSGTHQCVSIAMLKDGHRASVDLSHPGQRLAVAAYRPPASSQGPCKVAHKVMCIGSTAGAEHLGCCMYGYC